MLNLKPGKHNPAENWPKWGRDPHNPYSGKDRPAFSWPVFYRYAEGKVDADGNPIKEATPCEPPRSHADAAATTIKCNSR